MSHGEINVENFVDGQKSFYGSQILKFRRIIYPFTEPFSREVSVEVLFRTMASNGLIFHNCGVVKIGYIGDSKCRYSLTPYAYHWLAIVDARDMGNNLPEKIAVFALVVSLVSFVVSLASLVLSLE